MADVAFAASYGTSTLKNALVLACALCSALQPSETGAQVTSPAVTIVASRLLGSHWDDTAENLLRAPDGKLYVYGRVGSAAFAGLPSAAYANAGQHTIHITRIDPVTLAPVWTVPVGRAQAKLVVTHFLDLVDGVAMGHDGRLYVAAYASSTRYPSAGGTWLGWGGAKYIYRVDANGAITPFAGPLDPAIRSIRALAVNGAGDVFLTGRASKQLVTTSGVLVPSSALGSATEAPFVMKLRGSNGSVAFATFLGVPGARAATPKSQACREPFLDAETVAYAMALADDGSIYLAGQARPNDLPSTASTATTPDIEYGDAFVMKLNATGTARSFVARIGGRDNDRATALLLAPDGNLIVAGKWLDKGLWHGAAGGFQAYISRQWYWSLLCESMVPTEAAFVLKLSPSGTQVGTASLIGAIGGDLAGSLAWPDPMPVRISPDGAGNFYLAGTTDSGQSLPTLNPAAPDSVFYHFNIRETRPFVMKIGTANLGLLWSTRFGSFRTAPGGAMGAAPDGFGGLVVVGNAPSANAFPIVHGGKPSRFSGAFATRFGEAPQDMVLGVNPPEPVAGSPVTLSLRLADKAWTGSIEFLNKGVSLGTQPLINSVATLQTTLPPGIHRISAVARGAAPWGGTSTVPRQVPVRQP